MIVDVVPACGSSPSRVTEQPSQSDAGGSQYRTLRPEQPSLPVRSPGAHLQPLLRRPPLTDRGGAGGSSG